MRILFSFLTIALLFSSCVRSQNKNVTIPVGSKTAPSPNEAIATFAEGCFWHSEIVFQSLIGVRDAVSGYAGGTDTEPTYEKVSSGETGHAESVQVYYDPYLISYETLVRAFFASHDPTTVNRQGNDVGSQYRSIAFYRNDKEREIIEKEIERINASKVYKNKVVTEVLPFTAFIVAENYHQEYIFHHPGDTYVNEVSIPDFLKFKKSFKAKYK